MSRRRRDLPPPPTDPYEVLGIDRRADPAEVKRAYYVRVREHPPEQDPETFQTIRSAYERLATPAARARTDLFLLEPPPETPARRLPSPDLAVHREDVLALAAARLLASMARRESFHEPERPEEEGEGP